MTLWATIPPTLNRRCRYCGELWSQLQCERCGSVFHETCHWRTRPLAERVAYGEAPIEASYMFCCISCRE